MKIFFFVLTVICGLDLCAVIREPGFDSGMRTDTKYQHACRKYPNEVAELKRLFRVYQKARAHTQFRKAVYKIPKKIHMIWIGSPPPKIVMQMFASWKQFHPTWIVTLWTDKDIESFHLKNKNAFETAKNWGEKSDIFRYEILKREGGVYVDADFECLKPFDDICKVADFFAGVAYSEGAPHILNGIVGCRPGHPIIERCVREIRSGSGDHNFQRILWMTGPHFFSGCFFDGIAQDVCGVVAPFPVTYFYPFPNAYRETYLKTDAVKRDWVHPESYAIHYWKISWQDPQYVTKK